LVDDDERSLDVLRVVLEPLEQRLVTARSGEDALRLLLREEFAVILLDMRMPGLDGLETARFVKARAATRHIPIIFLTAHAEDIEQVFRAYEAGAVDYVAKPFQPDVLRHKVAVFVELQHERMERVREARARAEAETIASTASKLQGISDAALAHLEIDELLPELLGRASTVFGADAAGLLLRDGEASWLTLLTASAETDRPRGDAGLPRGDAGLLPDRASRSPGEGGRRAQPRSTVSGEGLLAQVVGGAPLHVPELDHEHELPAALATVELGSLIAAPLAADGQQMGALLLGSRSPRAFSEEDLVVLGLSADRAAIAIQHARSYERERSLVEMLQHHLLPDRLPQAPALAMAARYRPSERAAQVGGDWYDAIVLPGGAVGLAIGDVVGHGVRAATLMGELRAALRAYALAEPQSPGAALSRLNTLVASTHGTTMVATVLYMVVDADGARVRFASAGHLPPLLMQADGAARFLDHQSAPPLGATEHASFRDWESELDAGGTILLYTDGLVERRGEPIDVGLQRLRTALVTAPDDLERLCSHVLARAPGGRGVSDDMALLAVRLSAPLGERLELDLPAEPESVARARHRMERWLQSTGGGTDDLFAIKLAVSEACANAVEHAYGPEPGRTFHLRAERSCGEVVVEISDRGRWRTPRGSRRGMGLRMMEQLMDTVEVKRLAAGTTVRMSKMSAKDRQLERDQGALRV
jgi:serine phosphatase RsbU (regulator of sigma subunit)/FixJ family two-component response regulator/anti-sigma regulatory factor (Ser/Thr protein kinase)